MLPFPPADPANPVAASRRQALKTAAAAALAGLAFANTPSALVAAEPPPPEAGPAGDGWNVRQAGARGDGTTDDTRALQDTINRCAEAGGGTVRLPPGRYLSGTLTLRDHVTLRLDAGATLLGSPNIADYDPKKRALVFAENAVGAAITGEGTIDGQGAAFTAPVLRERRPFLVRFWRCRRVRVSGVTLTQSAFWTLHFLLCDTVHVSDVTIFNDRDRINTDGIDPDCSRNVSITGCHIDTGDDCICIKANGFNQPDLFPCENIVVANCTLRTTCAALKIGNDLRADVRNITFVNNAIYDTPKGIDLTPRDRGVIDGVTILNTVMRLQTAPERPRGDHAWPIIVSLDAYRNQRTREVDRARLGGIRNVLISGLVAHAPGPCLIAGAPDRWIENFALRDVQLVVGGNYSGEAPRDPWYAQYAGLLAAPGAVTLRHVRGASLRDVRVRFEAPRDWPLLLAEQVADVRVDNLGSTEAFAGEPVAAASGRRATIRLRDCAGAFVNGCVASSATAGPFVALSGGQTARVTVMGNDLAGVPAPVVISDADVPAGVVYVANNREEAKTKDQ